MRNKRYQFKKAYKKQLEKTAVRRYINENKGCATCFKIHDASSECLDLSELNVNDCLFKVGEGMIDPFLASSKERKEILMPEGYVSAALNLLEIIKKTDSNFVRNSYIFPALFCFRQYLELTMKISIAKFGASDGKYKDGHNLLNLWSSLHRFLAKDKKTEKIGELIKELENIDCKSTFFRYPYQKGEQYMTKQDGTSNELIDVENLQTKMLQLYSFFEGISCWAYNTNDVEF